jgi:hypothetical protein
MKTVQTGLLTGKRVRIILSGILGLSSLSLRANEPISQELYANMAGLCRSFDAAPLQADLPTESSQYLRVTMVNIPQERLLKQAPTHVPPVLAVGDVTLQRTLLSRALFNLQGDLTLGVSGMKGLVTSDFVFRHLSAAVGLRPTWRVDDAELFIDVTWQRSESRVRGSYMDPHAQSGMDLDNTLYIVSIGRMPLTKGITFELGAIRKDTDMKLQITKSGTIFETTREEKPSWQRPQGVLAMGYRFVDWTVAASSLFYVSGPSIYRLSISHKIDVPRSLF